MEHSRVKANQLVKQTTSKLSTVKWKGTNPKWQPNNNRLRKRMMRNLLRRNLVLRDAAAARRLRSDRPTGQRL